jgi:hypothetical protein
VDDVTARLEEAAQLLHEATRRAVAALRAYDRSSTECCLTPLRRVAAIGLALVNSVCVWGEISLAIDKSEWSLFNFVSRQKMPAIVGVVCVSTPILSYLLFVGAWSLTHLKLGSFFRFTKGCTNANTLNYFAVILCRLGPTISFHYVTQIGAKKSELMNVMGVMDKVVFIGNDWNIYAPILLVVMIAFFAFNVPGCIAFCCGKDNFTFDYTMVDYGDLAEGEGILKELDSSARDLIDGGLRYSVIMHTQNRRNIAGVVGSDFDSSLEARLTGA